MLILLDCCSAGGTGGNATKGTKEVIAACGFETWAPGVGDHSFTKSLIDELKYLSTGPSFSVSSLHSRVLDRLKHWNPIYNAERLLMEGPGGRYQDQERRKTPVYISLNKDRISRSIEIVPGLGTKNASRAVRRTSTANPMGGTDETLAAMTDYLTDDRYKHVEVTLSIQVATGQILYPNDMVNWIRDLPLLAKSVRLQAIVPSMSTLLIVSLPVSTWNLLPSNPACSFVGFTTATNWLIPEHAAIQSANTAQFVTSDRLASGISQNTPGFATAQTDTSQERALNTSVVESPLEGKKVPEILSASTVKDELSKEFTEIPSIESALPNSTSSKSEESDIFDPVRSSSSSEARKLWVPGRVSLARRSLLSEIRRTVAHEFPDFQGIKGVSYWKCGR